MHTETFASRLQAFVRFSDRDFEDDAVRKRVHTDDRRRRPTAALQLRARKHPHSTEVLSRRASRDETRYHDNWQKITHFNFQAEKIPRFSARDAHSLEVTLQELRRFVFDENDDFSKTKQKLLRNIHVS